MIFYKKIKYFITEPSIRGKGIRFSIFLCVYILGNYPQTLLDTTSFGNFFLTPIHETLANSITTSCCFILRYNFPDIHASCNHTIYISSKPIIQLLWPCTGLDPMIRLTIILLIYPIDWFKKSLLWPISLLILLLASVIHFLTLILVSFYLPEWFSFAHNWFTRIIFYSFYFLCWIIWEHTIESHDRSYPS